MFYVYEFLMLTLVSYLVFFKDTSEEASLLVEVEKIPLTNKQNLTEKLNFKGIPLLVDEKKPKKVNNNFNDEIIREVSMNKETSAYFD